MSAQEAFWNWLQSWAAVGAGLLIAIVAAVLIAAFGNRRRESDRR